MMPDNALREHSRDQSVPHENDIMSIFDYCDAGGVTHRRNQYRVCETLDLKGIYGEISLSEA